MKNILTLFLISMFAFVGVESAKAGIIVFNQDFEYVEQTPGEETPKQISAIYSGGAYTFYVSSTGAWELNTTPSGLSFSVNDGTYMPSYAEGGTGFSSVSVKADPSVQGPFKITLTIVQEGLKYNYELLVEPKPAADGKFSCPTSTAEIAPGSSMIYTDVVSLKVTGNPVLLTPGRILGLADEGRIKIDYAGQPLVVSAGEEKLIPVGITVAAGANPGTYNVPLDQISNVESGCTWTIVVAAQCNFTLNCSNPTISPNVFTQNTAASSSVSMDYTLSGCTSFSFPGVANVASTGVEGLILNLNAQSISTPSGKITGTITGTPTTAGTATFNIPGYCSFNVEVKPGTPIFEVDCNSDITICKPTSCCTALSEYAAISYTLTSGTKEIPRWVGSKVYGIYAEVPAQTAKAPSGTIQVIIKGKPTKTGIIKLPVNIAGKVCYINVNIITSGELIVDCSKAPSLAAIYKKSLCCKTVYMTYSLSCGKQAIRCSTGPKVNGVYAVVPAQTVKEASSGKIKVYIKGCPTVRGTIQVPVNINGTTCYVTVNVQ